MKLTTQMYQSPAFLDEETLLDGVAFDDPEMVFTSSDEEALNEFLRDALDNETPMDLVALVGLPSWEEDGS